MRRNFAVCVGVFVALPFAYYTYLSNLDPTAGTGSVYYDDPNDEVRTYSDSLYVGTENETNFLHPPALAEVHTEASIDDTTIIDDARATGDEWHHVLLVQRQRKALIKKACSQQKYRALSIMPRMMIDPNRKVMFCNIAKVGSTVWVRTMAQMALNITEYELTKMAESFPKLQRNPTYFIHDYPKKFGLDTTASWTRDTWKTRAENYYKFMFVRNPFDRLKSTYRDKFLLHDERTSQYYMGKVGQFIRQKYRPPDAGIRSLEVTFEEFLRFVLGRHMFNYHWTSQVETCDPCGIEYDFIGHMETLADDAEYIFKNVFHSNLNVTKTLHPSYGPSATAHILDKPVVSSTYYDEVPDSVIQGIRDYFSVDAEMFGYDFDRQPVNVTKITAVDANIAVASSHGGR